MIAGQCGKTSVLQFYVILGNAIFALKDKDVAIGSEILSLW